MGLRCDKWKHRELARVSSNKNAKNGKERQRKERKARNKCFFHTSKPELSLGTDSVSELKLFRLKETAI